MTVTSLGDEGPAYYCTFAPFAGQHLLQRCSRPAGSAIPSKRDRNQTETVRNHGRFDQNRRTTRRRRVSNFSFAKNLVATILKYRKV